MDYTDKRVRLKAIPENGVGVEEATVIHDYGDGMLMVQVDKQYFVDRGDDGLREVDTDQIDAVL